MAIKLPPDFKDFLRYLNSHNVDYLVIGGFAVGFHGYPRTTSAIDIWIRKTPENAERVVKSIREFGLDTPSLALEILIRPIDHALPAKDEEKALDEHQRVANPVNGTHHDSDAASEF